MYQKKGKIFLQTMSPHCHSINVAMAHRNYFMRNNLQILKLATIQKLKITILVQIGNFLDWKGLPNVHILFCLPKTPVLLICNENKEISVANLMIQ